MVITIRNDYFLNILKSISKIPSDIVNNPDSQSPYIKIKAMSDGTAYIESTDASNMQWVRIKMSPPFCNIEQEGEICIPHAILFRIMSSVNFNNYVRIAEDGERAAIYETDSDKNEFFNKNHIGCIPHEQWLSAKYPTNMKKDDRVYVPMDVFKESIEKISFACTKDNSKAPLTSMKINIKDGRALFSAGDLYKMALWIAEDDNIQSSSHKEVLLLPDIIKNAHSIFTTNKEKPFMYIDSKKVFFQSDSIEYIAATEVGIESFPDFVSIVNNGNNKSCEIDSKEFKKAIKMAFAIVPRAICNIVFHREEIHVEAKLHSDETEHCIKINQWVDDDSDTDEYIMTVGCTDIMDALKSCKEKNIIVGIFTMSDMKDNSILFIKNGNRNVYFSKVLDESGDM